MKKLPLLLLSLLLAATVGCQKIQTSSDTDQESGLSFVGDIDEGTIVGRASATKSAFVSGDKIGIFVVPYKQMTPTELRGVLASSGNYADNVPFKHNGTSFVPNEVSDKITFPNATTKIDVYAFAMYHTQYNTLGLNPTQQLWKVDIDQSLADGTTILKNDLMTAVQLGVTPTAAPINLVFKHRLAKVEGSFVAPATYQGETVTSTELYIENTRIETVVNMTDTTVAPVISGATINPIKCHQSDYVAGTKKYTFEAIVAPQDIVAGVIVARVVLKTSGSIGTFNFNCVSPVNVSYGKSTITRLNLKFDNEYNLQLAAVSITPWIDNGTITTGARRPAVMNFTYTGGSQPLAESVKSAILGVDDTTYTATVTLEGTTLHCAYLQPEHRSGAQFHSVILKSGDGTIIPVNSYNPVIPSPAGLDIVGNPTEYGYNKIITTLGL